jgi:sugar phosphate isomerase/epimerase
MAKISAFADEIGQDLSEQIETLKSNDVGYIELRRVWGKNVMELTDDELMRVAREAEENGIGFSAVGSPIGKFSLDDDFSKEIESLKRAIDIAYTLQCPYIRMFSYFIPEGDDPAKHRTQCIDQVGQLAAICKPAGVKCALENEKGIYSDTGERFLDILDAVDSPALVGAFDPANFVQCGQRPYEDCWVKVKHHVEYFHIKDAVRGSGEIALAGQGDGDIPRILGEAFEEGFDNFLTLEPHLQVAADSYGETGPALFKTATDALKSILSDIGAC